MIYGLIGFLLGIIASLIAMKVAGCEDEYFNMHDHDSEFLKPVTKEAKKWKDKA